jgi:hypothetical protein
MTLKPILSLLALMFASATYGDNKPTPLKLTDGRVFTEWRIMSETATHVFLKHRGGGVKVAKQLLPAELRAAYPIDEAKAKAEAAALAESERVGKQRKAEVEAERIKQHQALAAKSAARSRAVGDAVEKHRTGEAIRQAIDAESSDARQAEQYERMYAIVRTRAKRYYEAERRNGSGATLVFKIDYEFNEPRQVPGWSDRYEITGVAHYQYYDSVWGGSFSSHVGYFSALIAKGRCVDFTPRSSPTM